MRRDTFGISGNDARKLTQILVDSVLVFTKARPACAVPGCLKTMKKSVVNNNEAALIMGCSKSHICNLAVRYGWHFKHHGSQKMWLLADVCKAAKVKQKDALDKLEAGRMAAGKTREIKIQWP